MSLVTQAMSNAYYTNMLHNSAYSYMLNSPLKSNKVAEINRLQDSLENKIADEMLKNDKNKQIRGFDTFA